MSKMLKRYSNSCSEAASRRAIMLRA